jgi:hypothetical protein
VGGPGWAARGRIGQPGPGRGKGRKFGGVEQQPHGPQAEQLLDPVQDVRQFLVGPHHFDHADGLAEFFKGRETAFEPVDHGLELGLQVYALFAVALGVLAAVEEFLSGQGGGIGPHLDRAAQLGRQPLELVGIMVLEGLLQLGEAVGNIREIESVGHDCERSIRLGRRQA